VATVNPNTSTTFKTVTPGGFSIRYGDDTTSKGDYFSDTLKVGSQSVSNLTMGLATVTNVTSGLLGIGFVTGEAVNESAQYPNLPVQMVNAGLIPTPAYSLWLNDLGKQPRPGVWSTGRRIDL
jgi:hypothetical protein